jgi:hypothetical protein
LVALLVYAGGVQASQPFDEEGELSYRCSWPVSLHAGPLNFFFLHKEPISYTITKKSQDILLSVLQKLTLMWGDRHFVRNTQYTKQLST